MWGGPKCVKLKLRIGDVNVGLSKVGEPNVEDGECECGVVQSV